MMLDRIVLVFVALMLSFKDVYGFSAIQAKLDLLRTCATCDRGFYATASERQRINTQVEALISSGGGLEDPTMGLAGSSTADSNESSVPSSVPLEGLWSLVYTDAFDVVSLASSPLTALRGIYFEIDRNGESSNIIDFAPRFEANLPTSINLGSTLRARVKTRSKARSTTRVGLSFIGAALEPQTLLGFDVKFAPPLGVDFPSLPSLGFGAESNGGEDDNSPGFYDIRYLDDELLILNQNEPGGVFISSRVHPE